VTETKFSPAFERFLDFVADQMVIYYMKGGIIDGEQCEADASEPVSGEERSEHSAGQSDQGWRLYAPEHD